jgi:hypothetical protein
MKERENADLRAVVDLVNSNHESTQKALEAMKQAQDKKHEELLEFVRSGFPDGDAHAHKAYHAAVLKTVEGREELRKELVKKIVTGSVWGFILFFFTYGMDAIKGYFKEHFK